MSHAENVRQTPTSPASRYRDLFPIVASDITSSATRRPSVACSLGVRVGELTSSASHAAIDVVRANRGARRLLCEVVVLVVARAEPTMPMKSEPVTIPQLGITRGS